MRTVRTTAIVAALLCGAGVLIGAPGAYADAAVPIYVNNATGANCSDAGTGTQSQPYCTIAAAMGALQPSGTLDIAGKYTEHVTVPVSGTPGHPVTLQRYPSGTRPTFTGATTGLTIDGQHDVTVTGLSMNTSTVTVSVDGPVVVNNATRITMQNDFFVSRSTSVTLRLTGVSDSSLTGGTVSNSVGSAVLLDAATSGVLVKSDFLSASNTTTARNDGIDIGGSHNTVLDSDIGGGRRSAIWLESSAVDTVVANNYIQGAGGYGISNDGAPGTAVTNNTIQNTCATGIRIAGASSGVSVQNNVLIADGGTTSSCDASITQRVDIGVYDNAVAGTVVDYNSVFQGVEPFTYAWPTPMTLAAFRIASGQATHDTDLNLNGQSTTGNLDSANSAAPGYQSTDFYGIPRVDSPQADTGAGPVTYADRGYTETDVPPTPRVAVAVDQTTRTVTADASSTVPGWEPITSYIFSFGDGSSEVTQSTPVATHKYAQAGVYLVSVSVTVASGRSANTPATATVAVVSPVRTIALLSRADNRFVTAESAGTQPLIANRPAAGVWELFDVLQAGTGGPVVLRSHANNNYVAAVPDGNGTYHLVADQTTVDTNDEFSLVTNADGTISLSSLAQDRYVTAENAGTSALVVNRTAIGVWEEFYTVDVTHTTVSLHAHANSNFVTAESGGTKPLIANRTAAGSWEQFDVVDAGNGQVALLSHADGKFVTAEGAGTQPLIANRTTIGPWELFTLTTNADGSASLLANANGQYVTAETAGTQPLIANRTAIGAWEKFDLNRTG